MIFLTSVTNAVQQIINGKKLRMITASLFGPDDAKSAPEAGPAGYDAPPDKNLTAVFVKTNKRGATTFIGYINTDQIAAAGERRIYATDGNGTEKAKLWLHNNGNVEIGGTSDAVNPYNLTQYQAMDAALQDLINQANIQLGDIATAITALGGVYTVVPLSEDFTLAKATKLLIE